MFHFLLIKVISYTDNSIFAYETGVKLSEETWISKGADQFTEIKWEEMSSYVCHYKPIGEDFMLDFTH